MKYSSLLLSSAFLASSLSYADYQFELDAALAFGSGTSEYDYGYGTDEIDYDTSGSLLGATVYLGSVNTGDVPLQEAAFLSRQSYGSLYIIKNKTEWDDGDENSSDSVNLSGRFVIADKVILGAVYSDLEQEYSSFEREQADGRAIGLEGGAYLSENAALIVSYSQAKTNWDDYKAKNTSFGVMFEQVNAIGASKHIAWHVGLEKLDFEVDYDYWGTLEDNYIGVQAGLTFYFTNQFGVGANIVTYMVEGKGVFDDYDGAQSTFMPHLSYDFNESVGVYLITESQVTVLEYDDGDEYTNASLEYTFGLNVRF